MLTTAFILGITGSLHCVGMCGPLALQVKAADRKYLIMNRLFYNGGRIITYSFLGLVAGTFGHLMQISGWQGKFSIALGLIVLLTVFFRQIERLFSTNLSSMLATIRKGILRHLNRKSSWSALVVGMLNGFLPCGLVYAAIVLSLVQSTWMESVLIMTFFGLGTVPALFIAAWTVSAMLRYIPISLQKIQMLFVVGMALIMIWRGISIEGLFSIDQTVLCYPIH